MGTYKTSFDSSDETDYDRRQFIENLGNSILLLSALSTNSFSGAHESDSINENDPDEKQE